MPPTVVLVRHAQAIHNIDSEFFSMEVTVGMTMLTTQTEAYHSVHDPGLSDLGRQQAAELREHLKTHLPPGRKVIVVSPMRRALQTCLIALDWLIDTGVPVILDARWQELYPKPCDTGTPASQLAVEFPQLDFSELDPVYPDKTSPVGARYHCQRDAVLARGQAALADLYARDADVAIVISHSGFMRTAVAGRWFANADYRVFDFATKKGQGKGEEREMPGKENEPYRLAEWEMTSGKGGMGRSRVEAVVFGEGVPE